MYLIVIGCMSAIFSLEEVLPGDRGCSCPAAHIAHWPAQQTELKGLPLQLLPLEGLQERHWIHIQIAAFKRPKELGTTI